MVVGEPWSNGPCGFMGKDDAEQAGMPWAALVYDEHRSFTSHLPLDTPGIEDLLRLIRRDGWRGIKGYFSATRESEHLRIFSDRVLPQPSW